MSDVLGQPGGLGDRLAETRRAAGLSGQQLAQRLKWGPPKVSKIERGNQKPTPEEIRLWASACGLKDASDLLELLSEAEAEHSQFRHRLKGGGAIRLQEEYDTIVRGAKRIRNFEMFAVPGLVQTSAYALAMLTGSAEFNDVTVETDAAVAAKMRRQDVLYEPGRDFEFVILPQVLEPRLVPPGVMLGQLDKLLSVSGLPRVSLGIVRDGRFPAVPQESVLIADEVVVYETSPSSVRVTGREAEMMVKRFEEFAAGAARGDEARQMILQASDAARRQLTDG